MNNVVPYLIRAYCDWMEDSSLTPYILVDCEKPGIIIPPGHAKDGKITLNISSTAAKDRNIANDTISFTARFGGNSEKISVPCHAILAIYAHENGEGMFFDKINPASSKPEGPNLTVLD